MGVLSDRNLAVVGVVAGLCVVTAALWLLTVAGRAPKTTLVAPMPTAQASPTDDELMSRYKGLAETQFNTMFRYGRAEPLETEVHMSRGQDWDRSAATDNVRFLVLGKVDVEYAGRRQTMRWKLGYHIRGRDPHAAATLEVRDVWSMAPDSMVSYDWSSERFR